MQSPLIAVAASFIAVFDENNEELRSRLSEPTFQKLQVVATNALAAISETESATAAPPAAKPAASKTANKRR